MRFKTDETLKYVLLFSRIFDKQDVQSVMLVILLDLGFHPGNDGFRYLQSAVELWRAESMPSLSKDIYPAISRRFHAGEGWKHVEQAIRRAITAAWNERDAKTWSIFFPEHVGCPTNKDFIARLACIIELWQNCKEVSHERVV